jgi:hypothetical protein
MRSPSFAPFAFGCATIALIACGQTLSTLDHPCPCETGWTCCSDKVCVPPGASCGAPADASIDAAPNQCPEGIQIGNSTLPTFGPDGSVAPFPAGLSMTGQVMSKLPTTADTVSFDYSTSATLTDGGVMSQDGWILVGGNTEQYRFDVYAKDDSSQLPLQLAVYGPIETGPGPEQCFAPLVDNGPLGAGAGTFAPPKWGQYFITAYHPIDVAQNGAISIQSEGDHTYANAYLNIEPLEN